MDLKNCKILTKPLGNIRICIGSHSVELHKTLKGKNFHGPLRTFVEPHKSAISIKYHINAF